MLCRTEMPTNEQIFGRFYRYKLLHGTGGGRGAASRFMAPILLVLAAVFFLITGMPVVLAGGLLAVVAGWMVYLLFITPNLQFRKKEGAALQNEVTIFTGSGLDHTVRSEEGGMGDHLSMQYGTLVRAVETGRDFYLFTGPAQAILIDKAYFTKGGPDELRAVLAEKLGAKFKGKK